MKVNEKPECLEGGSHILHGGPDYMVGCSYLCSTQAKCVGFALYNAGDVQSRCNVKLGCNNFDFQGEVYEKGKTI